MSPSDYRDDAAAYALGALDAEAKRAFETAMASDAEMRQEVDAYREVAALLALALPTAQPRNPQALRERIVAEAAQVTPLRSGRAAASVVSTAHSVRAPQAGRIAWYAAAASLVIALGSGAAYRAQRIDNERLAKELVSARRDADASRAVLASRDSVLEAFLGPMVHVVSLAPGDDPKPSARVFWNHTKSVFIVTAFNVPQAPKGKTYQLWALRKGQAPISMGTFNTDPSGRALAIVPVGSVGDAGFIDNCGLTLEPEGGSPQPTETPRLIGSWRHVD